jgi:D-alanyl-D-alanine carboxypeptidase (penicillin-binding protein 5/6)
MLRTLRFPIYLIPLGLALYCLAMVPASASLLPVPSPPNIPANSYILMGYKSGKILAQKNVDEHIPPASMTKMMSLYIVFHELKNGQIKLDDKVRISKKAWKTGGSKMFVEAGSRVSVKDLIRGVIVDSGNDATVALAQYVGGTVPTFVHYMNHFAKKLGMDNTHFENPTGLPHPDHYSTARDLATLVRALIRRYPKYYKFFGDKKMTWSGIKQYNRNELLFRDPSVDGLKTGHTKAAGYCLAASGVRQGMRMITVVTHTASNDARASTSEALLNYAFRFYNTVKVQDGRQAVKKLKVWKGASDQVPIGLPQTLYVTVPKQDAGHLKTEISTAKQVVAPVEKGQKLGTMKITANDKLVAVKPLHALQAVKSGGFVKKGWDSVKMFFAGLF